MSNSNFGNPIYWINCTYKHIDGQHAKLLNCQISDFAFFIGSTKGDGRKISSGVNEKTRPKNSSIRPPSTLSESCMKIQGGCPLLQTPMSSTKYGMLQIFKVIRHDCMLGVMVT